MLPVSEAYFDCCWLFSAAVLFHKIQKLFYFQIQWYLVSHINFLVSLKTYFHCLPVHPVTSNAEFHPSCCSCHFYEGTISTRSPNQLDWKQSSISRSQVINIFNVWNIFCWLLSSLLFCDSANKQWVLQEASCWVFTQFLNWLWTLLDLLYMSPASSDIIE